MKKVIRVSVTVRDKIMEKYNVTRQAVWLALNFVTRGARPDAIRKDALDMGGRYYEENFTPNCTCQHTENGIIQTFAAGVVLTITQGDAVITKHDKVIARADQIDCSGWGALCEQAQKLAETGMLDMAV
ncbi:MAG: hypothetical protein IJ307_05700 [Bacteroidales bacterium]|nr:hypothetical protein [Bacteroidales bacterium]